MRINICLCAVHCGVKKCICSYRLIIPFLEGFLCRAAVCLRNALNPSSKLRPIGRYCIQVSDHVRDVRGVGGWAQMGKTVSLRYAVELWSVEKTAKVVGIVGGESFRRSRGDRLRDVMTPANNLHFFRLKTNLKGA